LEISVPIEQPITHIQIESYQITRTLYFQ